MSAGDGLSVAAVVLVDVATLGASFSARSLSTSALLLEHPTASASITTAARIGRRRRFITSFMRSFVQRD